MWRHVEEIFVKIREIVLKVKNVEKGEKGYFVSEKKNSKHIKNIKKTTWKP